MSAGGVAAAWLLTARICPREHVRVATVDASGATLNQYAHQRSIHAEPPTVPWALPLADHAGYHLVAFDLDAKHGTAPADADTLSRLLTAHGIEHLVARSGPSDGRHLWLALTRPAEPTLVASLARLVAARCRSLDLAPLSNPATGCVRPPGSPHRDGGTATVLTGTTGVLTRPTTTPEQLHALVIALAADINQTPAPASTGSEPTGIRIDGTGQPYLPGTATPLPPGSAAALQQTAADTDASAVLWRVLIGAAAHHWHLTDIAALAPAAPGLEHLRSRRSSTGPRQPRSRYDQAATLTRQWRYAVAFAAAHPRDTGIDATFDQRAGDTADTIRALQARADAAPGRWTHGGGPADRRVLDTLHQFALAAVSTVVEADIRRIALTCGIGRETARTALLRLTADGWISRASDATGVHGASWNTNPGDVLHRSTDTARSQAATRPAGAGAAERTLLLDELRDRNRLRSHDTFTTVHALPLAAGNCYARLSSTAARSPENAADLDTLHTLAQHGLARPSPTGWIRTEPVGCDAVAVRLGVAGRLRDRANRYRAEREIWSWWQAEHDWMASPRPAHDRRQPAAQAALWHSPAAARYPKHPRRTDGRADYAAARTARDRGALEATVLAA